MAVENLITEHIDIWTSAVKTKSASGRGSSKKLELYGIKKLRELILELAIRGKLVPQDPSDEPASVLLERIAAEKAQLVREKKTKKSKNLPPIIGEEPFALPKGWEFIRWGDMAYWAIGSGFPKSAQGQRGNSILFSKVSDMNLPGNEKYIKTTANTISEEAALNIKAKLHPKGTVIFPKIGGAIATNKRRILTRSSAIDNNCLGLIPSVGITTDYLYLILNSADLVAYQAGTSVPALSQSTLELIVAALPPLSEQRRIVAKVDELMALCDQLEQQTEASIEAHQVLVTTLLDTLTNSADADELMQNWAKISEHFDTLFTTEESIDQLKQTILQLAVMGKLVPQDPSDEPAAELLKRIAEEKAQLVKEKKIKKEKALPPIAEDEKPFELPNGWEWCRLEDVVDIQSGITKGRKLAGRELKTIPYLSVANVQRGYLILNNVKEIDLPIDELEKYSVEDGDLLITEGGDWDKVGRTAIWRSEVPYMAHQNHVFKARPFLKEQSEAWLEMYLNGPFARKYFAGSSKQTTNLASINKTQLRSCLIAVPPRDEKKEISDRVQELIGMCDLLLEGIRASLQTQLQLTDVIVDQAV
ncbi:restriction endonuclease subunit S [Vibrio parahaemolyticus]|uniref:restriction endonuclease subunit S n=1 Tax=Vibrio parahaemolyticus TaxID=670 RepID=UPI00061B3C99|nr:restriction endonuclease subunit S [Vibrio parahaemolyticus]EJG1162922.1 restriction endonuclease subunit S [Vibrio parahaemolyticus]EJL8301719.1 restriction endonuclease subunit S [Vibrio parahaemolyticus]EJU9846155.1 restriction endonuclease subunit S [Vibrio parahaemolyticus]ELC0684813.1 restriction endonuclease subunit S [Vibrio parahaemolyticus]KKC92222.1 restriction endonuclease EcoAI subunit S [Vibrio parahaemolyticus]